MARTLYLIYFFIIALPMGVCITIVVALVTIVASLAGSRNPVAYYAPKLWARAICRLTLVRVTVSGRENINPATSYMFVANHQGAYDIFAVYGWLGHNFKWMMKASLRRIPLVGFACVRAGHIMVDRSSPGAVRHTIEKAEATLRDGMSIVIFPEGARTWDGTVGPFKKGAYQLAMEFGLPMVPITIDGAFRVLPRFKRLPRPGHIHLTIHPPIEAPATEADRRQAIELTRQAIISALD